MDRSKLLKRLLLLKRNPELYKDLSNQELAEFVLVVLSQVETIDKAIKEGIFDGYTPQSGKDYLGKKEGQALLSSLYKQAVDNLASKNQSEYTKLEKAIQARLNNLRDGKDGNDALVTDELVNEIAAKAYSLITLPNFEALITQEPGAIRDALELLQGDERLEQSAIKNLPEDLDQIRREVNTTVARNEAGGISRNTVERIAWINGSTTQNNKLTVSATEPTNPRLQDLWIDLS